MHEIVLVEGIDENRGGNALRAVLVLATRVCYHRRSRAAGLYAAATQSVTFAVGGASTTDRNRASTLVLLR
jgi:hypothetical protein